MSRTLEELCDGLRKNDPSITDVSIPTNNHSRLNALLKALEGNVRVWSVTLGVCGPPSSQEEFPGLCKYLRESKVLQSVTFTCATSSCRPGLPGSLVRAMTGNSSIQEVTVCRNVGIDCCPENFLAFLQSKAQSLKSLSIPLVHWTDELRLAIGSLQALECFSIVNSFDCPVEFLLQQLQSYRRLRKLSIVAEIDLRYFSADTIVHPLSSLLHSGTPLKSLELSGFRLSRGDLVPLLDAMHSCSTLIRLKLTGDWEVDAAHDLATWLHKPCESSLRELGLGWWYPSDVVAVMTSMFTFPEGSSQQSSVASLLRVLELDSLFDDIAFLLAALMNKRSRISTLSLCSLNDVTGRQLTQCLPDMMNLRNLHINRMWDFDPATVPPAVRRNGSLHTVTVGSGWPWFSTTEKRRIQSYCDRNRYTRGLLQKLDDEDGPMRLSLSPLLFHAIKPAWRMAPSAFLGGLLACKEAIGPRGHVKRMAS
jgi:hypothetical protein